MKKYHITIKDNETGEITHDYDTGAIVGGVEAGDGYFALGLTECNAIELVNTICSAEKAIEAMLEGHPELLALKSLATIKKAAETEEAEETETTEN